MSMVEPASHLIRRVLPPGTGEIPIAGASGISTRASKTTPRTILRCNKALAFSSTPLLRKRGLISRSFMAGYIIRRIISLFFVLLVVATAVFFLMNAVPGGPFTVSERGVSPVVMQNVLRKYGLDKPVTERYWNYLTSALHLDFGNSTAVAGNPPVTELIARVWPVTLQVGLYTIILSFGLGFLMGLVAAYFRNSWFDSLVTLLATLGITVPNFIVATWLLLIFSYQIGWGSPDKWIIGPIGGQGPAILSWDYFLPVITYALAPLALVARYTRSSVAEALGADYIRTARAKGLTERLILFRHVLRNALIPMITVLRSEEHTS